MSMINVIGQTSNKKIIDYWASRNNFPRFLVITGKEGSGKSTLVKYITDKMKHYIVYSDTSVENVREVIKNCYSVTSPTVYIFLNADKMSAQAKNALLKVTEEPPYSAYFILTANNMSQLLPTIKSRCVEMKIEPYSHSELLQYCQEDFIKYAQCPGDIDNLKQVNVQELETFCNSLLQYSMNDVVQAVLLCNNIKFKPEDSGFDVKLVLSVMYYILCDNYVCTCNSNYNSMLQYLAESRYKMDNYNITKHNEFIGLMIRFNSLWEGDNR